MRRSALDRRLWWIGAAALVALIVLLPMRLVLGLAGLDNRGLSARAVDGSVWDAVLSDARLGEIELGDVGVGLAPFALLTGEVQVGFRALDKPEDTGLRGAIAVGRGVRHLAGELPVRQIFAPLPIASVTFDDLSVVFAGPRCTSASGQVRANLYGGVTGIDGLALPSAVAGAARCEGDAVVLPLTSQSGTESLTLRWRADGRYRAEFALRLADSAMAAKLALIGFVPAPNGYRLSVEGRF